MTVLKPGGLALELNTVQSYTPLAFLNQNNIHTCYWAEHIPGEAPAHNDTFRYWDNMVAGEVDAEAAGFNGANRGTYKATSPLNGRPAIKMDDDHLDSYFGFYITPTFNTAFDYTNGVTLLALQYHVEDPHNGYVTDTAGGGRNAMGSISGDHTANLYAGSYAVTVGSKVYAGDSYLWTGFFTGDTSANSRLELNGVVQGSGNSGGGQATAMSMNGRATSGAELKGNWAYFWMFYIGDVADDPGYGGWKRSTGEYYGMTIA